MVVVVKRLPEGRRKAVGRKCSRCRAWWLGGDIKAPVCLFCPATGGEVHLLTQGDIDDDRRTEEAIRGDKRHSNESDREAFYGARLEELYRYVDDKDKPNNWKVRKEGGDDRRTEEAVGGDKADGGENETSEPAARAREDERMPLSDREFSTFLDIQAKLLKEVDWQREANEDFTRRLNTQKRTLDTINQDLLLHKTVVGRLLQAFMSPLRVVEEDDGEDDNKGGASAARRLYEEIDDD
jgi:hypothetical protein